MPSDSMKPTDLPVLPEKPPLAKPPSRHPQIAAIIVPPVAQEYPDRLLLTGQHAFGINIPAPEVYRQFDVPASFGTDPLCIWYNMLDA
jgi:hypothetical protein